MLGLNILVKLTRNFRWKWTFFFCVTNQKLNSYSAIHITRLEVKDSQHWSVKVREGYVCQCCQYIQDWKDSTIKHALKCCSMTILIWLKLVRMKVSTYKCFLMKEIRWSGTEPNIFGENLKRTHKPIFILKWIVWMSVSCNIRFPCQTWMNYVDSMCNDLQRKSIN
jgi:hypothetical protein